MTIEVGSVEDAGELGPLAAVLGHAFAFDPAQARPWFERAGIEEVRVAHDGAEIVGGLLRIPMAQAFGGRFVPMYGLAGVGVRADRRRQGVASEMLRQVLLELWEAGVGLSALYASNQPLYRRAGYEQAGGHYVGTIRPREIDVREVEGGRVALATPSDRAEVERLYRETALARSGHLDRGRYVWGRIWEPSDGSTVHCALLHDEKDRLEASVAYAQVRRSIDEGNLLRVVDASSRTSRGWRRIWSYLRDVSTMASEIRVPSSPTDPLYLQLPHPTMRLALLEPFLLRVVDPVAALEGRGYPKAQAERLVIRVMDPLLGDQTLTLDVDGGRAKVKKGGDPTAKISVRGLAAIYAGHLSPQDAAAVGLVEAGQRSLAALQALFAGPSPWMRDFF